MSGRGATGALPQADAAERALVGLALTAPGALDLPGVVDLRPEDFRSRRLATAWRLIRAGARDHLTLEVELARAGERVPLSEIVGWYDEHALSWQAPAYVALVRDAAARRRLLELAHRIQKLLADLVPTAEVVAAIREAIG